MKAAPQLPRSSSGAPLHGLMAEYPTAKALAEAVRAIRRTGYTKVEAYTPFPVEEVIEAVDPPRSKVPAIVLAGGILGGLSGFYLQYWINVSDYPLDIGGRPFNSWVAFIPPTFETTVLFAGIAALVGMLAVNGLPRPYHPVFNVARFRFASRDGYFLVVESDDPKFDPKGVRDALAATAAEGIHEVED